MVRMGSPAGTGGGNSVVCSHVGLSPRPLDIVPTVEGLLPLGASAIAGPWGRGSFIESLDLGWSQSWNDSLPCLCTLVP